MTRIIAGSARGRRLAVPPRGTRPTSDRTREALFSALAADDCLSGAVVLDLYAGSGALGLEAISRGARAALLVERDRGAVRVCRANAGLVGGDVTVTVADVGRLVAGPRGPLLDRFDLVFIDPPYETSDAIVVDVLSALLANGWLADGARVVVERGSGPTEFAWPAGFSGDRSRGYGGTVLWYGHSIVPAG